MLSVDQLWVHNGAVPVLRGVNLEIGASEIVCVIGANGAGKSTLLKAISGLIPVQRGSIYLDGREVTRVASHHRARMGICQSPEGRGIFATLSVMDNLLLGASSRHKRRNVRLVKQDIEQVFELFPRLKERSRQSAGTMSGGEQQMLALARALLGQPKIMLLDEPSLGLAPLLVAEIFRTIKDLSQRGLSILLVEQNAKAALDISDRCYVLKTGQIVLSGPCHELSDDEKVREAYLGVKVGSASECPETRIESE